MGGWGGEGQKLQIDDICLGRGGIGKSMWVDMEGGGVKNGQKLATSLIDSPLPAGKKTKNGAAVTSLRPFFNFVATLEPT